MVGGSINKSKYLPGKLDAIKYSYNIPLNVAFRGTLERQRLFLEEQIKK
jgi:hypothetical protein